MPTDNLRLNISAKDKCKCNVIQILCKNPDTNDTASFYVP